MGYRSDVAYKIRFDKAEEFWAFIAEAKLDPETQLCFSEDFEDSFKVDEQHHDISFLAEGWKWYDEYDEVQCHMNLWDKARERETDGVEVDGAYCRIGEESEDIDERYFGKDPYEMVRVSRQLVVDWM